MAALRFGIVMSKFDVTNPALRGPWSSIPAEQACAIEWHSDPAIRIFRGIVAGTLLSALFWTGAILPLLL